MLRRIIAPRVLRFALPGMGNVWQQVLKESALISVTGLTEILRQIHIGAGSTQLPVRLLHHRLRCSTCC